MPDRQSCQPKISVVVPSYNQAQFLDDALHSIVDQGYEPLEVLVLDGGSTDDSVEIIKRYESRLAFWRSARDGGQAAAISEGLDIATGEILAFINSDDMLAPGSLASVGKAFRDPATKWVIGDVLLVDEHRRPFRYLREPFFSDNWQIHVRNCVPQPSVFWRRQLYQQVGGIDPELKFCLDSDLWYRFFAFAPPTMLRRLLSYQRHHGDTKTANLQHVKAEEYPMVLSRHHRSKPSTGKLRTVFWRAHRITAKLAYGAYLIGWLRLRDRHPAPLGRAR